MSVVTNETTSTPRRITRGFVIILTKHLEIGK